MLFFLQSSPVSCPKKFTPTPGDPEFRPPQVEPAPGDRYCHCSNCTVPHGSTSIVETKKYLLLGKHGYKEIPRLNLILSLEIWIHQETSVTIPFMNPMPVTCWSSTSNAFSLQLEAELSSLDIRK